MLSRLFARSDRVTRSAIHILRHDATLRSKDPKQSPHTLSGVWVVERSRVGVRVIYYSE